MGTELDKIDIKILKVLQENATKSGLGNRRYRRTIPVTVLAPNSTP